MTGKTHRAAGLVAGTAIACVVNMDFPHALIAVAGSVLGSLLPDIDHKNSMISNKIKPVGVIVGALFGHRKLLHDFKLYLAIFLILFVLFPRYILLFAPVFWGIATHILLDALNPEGVPLWGKTRLSIASIPTGGFIDGALGIGLMLCGVALAILWGFRAWG